MTVLLSRGEQLTSLYLQVLATNEIFGFSFFGDASSLDNLFNQINCEFNDRSLGLLVETSIFV